MNKRMVDVQLTRCGHIFRLDHEDISATREVCEGANCCMLFSPVSRHLLMAVDLQALSATAHAWRIPDCTLRSTVHNLDAFSFSRLHTTHAIIMMSLCESEVRLSSGVHRTNVDNRRGQT